MKLCTKQLIEQGYCLIPLQPELQAQFNTALKTWGAISSNDKLDFSFPENTDGFFPFGSEYSRTVGNPDLYERFCYRYHHKSEHKTKQFYTSLFYAAVSGYERGLYRLAQRLLMQIQQSFNATRTKINIRHSSYMQFGYYPAAYYPGREYLQDPHEDGHLLTLIKPSKDGLVLFTKDGETRISAQENELIVITGSLLTLLSDGAVDPMLHAVLPQTPPSDRASLIYFVIPELQPGYTSFAGAPVDVPGHVNARHTSFGNKPFRV